MNHPILKIGLALFLLVPGVVAAGPIIRGGETVSVDESQTLAGDFYGFATSIVISGKAEDDVYLAGGTVTLNAPVAGDLTLLGGSVQVHGEVGDDLRIVGGDVTVADTVKGDLVVAAGVLKLLSTASVEGDLIFTGGELSIEGDVQGGIHGTADKMRVNGSVGGDVSVSVKSGLTLGSSADVGGGIVYRSGNELMRSPDAHVAGDVRRTDAKTDPEAGFLGTYAFVGLVLLFATFSAYVLGRGPMTRLVGDDTHSLGMKGLIGLAAFMVIPFMSAILFVSVIGSIVGLFLLLSYVALLVLSFILSGAFIGRYLARYVEHRAASSVVSVLLGTIVFVLFGLVPYIGGLLMFATIMVAFGSLNMALYRLFRAR